MRRLRFVTFLLVLLPLGAEAKSPRDSEKPTYAACMQRGSHAEVMDCMGAEYRRLKKLLDSISDQLTAISESDTRPALVAAQHQWAAYREAECSYEGLEAGGTFGDEIGGDCQLRMTAQRIQDLHHFLDLERAQIPTPRKPRAPK